MILFAVHMENLEMTKLNLEFINRGYERINGLYII